MHCVTIYAKADNFPDFHHITYEFKVILQEVILFYVAEEIRIVKKATYNIQLCATFKLIHMCA